jgi:hypothetical protein
MKPKISNAPKYGLLYFDHLQSESLSFTEQINDSDKNTCHDIQTKRENNTLTWDDIYAYQLILLKYLDLETLKSKIVGLRTKYQSLVGSTEYDEYIKLRAVDLTNATDATGIPQLQADYKYLIDDFCLRYSYVSAREDLRTKLLRYGALFTLCFFLIAAVIGLISLNTTNTDLIRVGSNVSTLFIVVVAGITGAFVSMQQRFQSISDKGDPVYNLSLLTHGWFSIFLSPISGAIFAVILYLFFVGGLLSGSIFPKIKTLSEPKSDYVFSAPVVTTETSDSTEQKPSNSSQSNANSANAQTTATPANSNSTTANIEQNRIIGLTDFLPETGPATGIDFALLIIWSFIAGFAERFVPDTLMRLVEQKKSNETTST